MVTAHIARILAGDYNKNFNSVLSQIQNAALSKKKREIILDLSYNAWLKDFGFDNFDEVMAALGYKVYNNQTSFKVKW